MASFSKLSVWPVGYFRAYSSWLLRNRKEVTQQIEVINAELTRIGDVTVLYGEERQADGSVTRTENRVGFRVTPNSSLGKLLRAYVANGGNPLDISAFLKPDSTEVIVVDENGSPVIAEKYPHGGVVAPMSAGPNEPLAENGQSGFSGHPGGYLRWDSYYPARQGGRANPGSYDHDGVVRQMHHLRHWANQTIDERIQRLEWQIIKLCDLREQLVTQRDETLVQAFGGTIEGVADLDETRFNPSMQVQNIAQEMYDLLYTTDPAGEATFSPNEQVPLLRFALLDVPSEANRFLLGG